MDSLTIAGTDELTVTYTSTEEGKVTQVAWEKVVMYEGAERTAAERGLNTLLAVRLGEIAGRPCGVAQATQRSQQGDEAAGSVGRTGRGRGKGHERHLGGHDPLQPEVKRPQRHADGWSMFKPRSAAVLSAPWYTTHFLPSDLGDSFLGGSVRQREPVCVRDGQRFVEQSASGCHCGVG